MAFLFEEDRGLTVVKDPYPHLGPGVYNVNQEPHSKAAYAPFLCTGKRQSTLANDKVKTPGPGQYEIQQGMGDAGVQAYMNKSTIIVKVQGNGSSAFKSGIERFQEDKRVKEIPGPGYYGVEKQPNHKQQPIHNPRIEDIRQQNIQRRINSIPEPKTQIGMVYDDIETLAQHQKMMQSQKQRVVGPTTYDINQPKHQKGLSWDKSTKPRFPQEQPTEIGPGRYNLHEDNRRKRNGSPAFLSETVRSYYDRLIYKTNREINAGLRKQINYKDQYSPGPGQYNDGRVSIKVQNKQREFQFFGSSLERFKESDLAGVGPGDYNVQNSSFDMLLKKKNYTNATFLSTSLKGPDMMFDIQPGPGQYDVQNDLYTDVRKKQEQGIPGQFGTRERRFNEKPPICKAGPGSYDIAKGERKRAVSSCFKSSSKRDPVNKSCGPDIGQYKLDQESIGYRIQKQMKFIRNLQKIDVQKPGFDCAEPRFKEFEQLQQQQIVPIRDPPLPATSTKQVTAPFKSQQPRLAYISRQYTPGVGKYCVEPTNWKINSFNTHYNKLLSDS